MPVPTKQQTTGNRKSFNGGRTGGRKYIIQANINEDKIANKPKTKCHLILTSLCLSISLYFIIKV
jgi:hypothetical protein